jgi:hypothetical protein
MSLLTPDEKRFFDVFLHEATTAPFTGPATQALHAFGVEYGDLSHIAWAYEQDVPRTRFEVGRESVSSPPLPWPDRGSELQRNLEIQRIWKQRNRVEDEPVGPNESDSSRDPAAEADALARP